MAGVVLLQDVVEALDIQIDESCSYLDLDSGQVETISHDLLSKAEAGKEPDLPKWQHEEWKYPSESVRPIALLSFQASSM